MTKRDSVGLKGAKGDEGTPGEPGTPGKTRLFPAAAAAASEPASLQLVAFFVIHGTPLYGRVPASTPVT